MSYLVPASLKPHSKITSSSVVCGFDSLLGARNHVVELVITQGTVGSPKISYHNYEYVLLPSTQRNDLEGFLESRLEIRKGDVQVTGEYPKFLIEYIGNLKNSNPRVPIVGSSDVDNGSAVVTVVTQGSEGEERIIAPSASKQYLFNLTLDGKDITYSKDFLLRRSEDGSQISIQNVSSVNKTGNFVLFIWQ